jgi:hypothetical protein
MEIQERPPHILKMLMAAPWEAMPEVRECPPPILKTSMVGPLEGGAKDLGASTIKAKNVDDGPSGRRCRRSRSAHHQCKKTSMVAPWEAIW